MNEIFISNVTKVSCEGWGGGGREGVGEGNHVSTGLYYPIAVGPEFRGVNAWIFQDLVIQRRTSLF